MVPLSNYHKHHPNQRDNTHKLCDETRHPRRKVDGGKAIAEQILAPKEISKSKTAGL